MKRFWTDARVVQADGCFTVQLDGRPMRLPDGPSLRLPGRALAEAIAAEWAQAGGQQGGAFSAEDVPLTRLAGTWQERVAPDPRPTAEALAAYAATDLLCYRAVQPEALAARQHAVWQPWLDWAATTYAARLTVTSGIMPVTQPQEAVVRLRAAVHALDPVRLTALGVLVPAFGSLVLGLAVAACACDAAAAYRASIVDELFEEEQWGIDDEGIVRRANIALDVAHAARFMHLAAEEP